RSRRSRGSGHSGPEPGNRPRSNSRQSEPCERGQMASGEAGTEDHRSRVGQGGYVPPKGASESWPSEFGTCNSRDSGETTMVRPNCRRSREICPNDLRRRTVLSGSIRVMSTDTQQIVSKAWNFAHVLRDDGLSYMAYTEQITFLLFLKM